MIEIHPTEVVEYEFTVLDDDGVPVTGLTDGDFTKTLVIDGTGSGGTVTITEVSVGIYTYSFAAGATGRYYLQITCTDPNVTTVWDEDFRCVIGDEVFVGRNNVIVSTVARFEFLILDRNKLPVTGISSFGDKFISKNGADQSVTGLAVSEIGSTGRYTVTYTPATTGVWVIIVGDQMRGYWKAVFDVVVSSTLTASDIRIEMDNNSTKLARVDVAVSTRATPADVLAAVATVVLDPATLSAIADALLDRADAIDGKTPREALQIIGATTSGESSGDPGTPTFKGLDEVTDRVAAIVDGDGNRTSVTYLP